MNKRLHLVIQRHIKGTPKKGYVKDLRIKICDIPHRVKSKIKVKDERVYITTKSLKHLYDVRTAQEFDFIISNFDSAITNPTAIYKDKGGKTGDLCLYVEFEKSAYFYVLNLQQNIYIVSAYRLSDINKKRKSYLSGYKLLWSWKGDLPSS